MAGRLTISEVLQRFLRVPGARARAPDQNLGPAGADAELEDLRPGHLMLHLPIGANHGRRRVYRLPRRV